MPPIIRGEGKAVIELRRAIVGTALILCGFPHAAPVRAASQAAAAAPLSFEVASIKPQVGPYPRSPQQSCRGIDGESNPQVAVPTPIGTCILTAATLELLIRIAYEHELDDSLSTNELVRGGPRWADTFTIVAKAEDASTATIKQLRQMLQTLLADRFTLKLHREMQEVSGFGLVVAKNGPKLRASGGTPGTFGGSPGAADATIGRHVSMFELAGYLHSLGIGPVVDRTGLQGTYDFTLTFDREGLRSKKPQAGSTGGSSASIFTALEEQLGLKVVSQKVRVDFLVIDSVEKPSED